MCGINGLSGFPEGAALVQNMNQAIRHRGPDAEGVWQDECLTLGHRRLSIIDLSPEANQPMARDGFIIVYNGEIYNFRELREDLKRKGALFKTRSDTEVVLELFRHYREESFSKLQGMFAFGLYDCKNKELYLVRDYFGIKPLFYWHAPPDRLAFSSECKSFLNLPGFRKELNPGVLVSCLNYLWPAGDEAIFKDVFKVPPAHYLKVRFQRNGIALTQRRYWEWPDPLFSPGPEQEHIEALSAILEKSVEEHLVSDVPVGAFLSGGLDSSLITTLARRHNPDLSTYTISISRKAQQVERMPRDNFYAQAVASYLGVRHTDIPVEPSVIDALQNMVEILDEPIGDPAAINTYLICRLARERGIKVLLSGMGADEIFAGYRRHYATLLSRKIQRCPGFMKKAVSRTLSVLPVRLGSYGLRPVRWAKRFFSFVDMPFAEAYMRSYSYYDRNELREIFNGRYDAEIDELFDHHDRLFNDARNWDEINRMCFTDIHMFMTGLNLTYTDRASMAASVEVRVPFIDKNVIEWGMSLPGSYKIKNNTSKYILKKVAERDLPKRIVYRPKASFGMPLRAWMNGELRELVDDVLSYDNIKKRGILNPDLVRTIIRRDREGREDHAYRIYQFLTLELWLRKITGV